MMKELFRLSAPVAAIALMCGCAAKDEPPLTLKQRWRKMVDWQDAAARDFVDTGTSSHDSEPSRNAPAAW